MISHSMSDTSPTRILILGAGFAGLYAALRLEKTIARNPNCQVTLVDKTNFTLFTPMLHEVAAGDLEASDIVNPVRKMLKRTTFYEATVESIDLATKSVTITFGINRQRQLKYDHLVIALGSQTHFFDDSVRANALQMKTLGDAIFLRNRMIGLLEAAHVEEDQAARRRMLTFVVAGGGFSGVETVGAMNDFLREALKFYPQLDPSLLHIHLIHAEDVLLPQYDNRLGRYAANRLRDAGIDVHLKTKILTYDGATVKSDSAEPIETATLIWTTGVVPPPLIQSLPMKKDHGRVVVNPTMESPEFPSVWVVGDCAHIPGPDGKPYPSTAQHAIRQGHVLAKNIEAAVTNRPQNKKPFIYRTLGQLAAIGHHRGVAQILGINFSGFIAWWLWRSTYLYKLPGLEKKIRVALNWSLDLFFARDLVQLITIDDLKRMSSFTAKHQLTSTTEKNLSPSSGTPGEGRGGGQQQEITSANPIPELQTNTT
jgi:NADH:ubiquinone reductase (H+-translocating)